MTKTELRIKHKELRGTLSETAIEEKSLTIANAVLKLPLWEKNYFHIFLPIVKHKEVNTESILHLLAGKDKNIILSKSNFKTLQLTHFLLTDNTTIRTNQYGIPEPQDGIAVPPSRIDVVFVPLLAFDKTGNRVGYGKGFYDVFLTECRPETIKIGLSFFEAEEEPIEDVFEGDVKLDYCITPESLYTF